MKSKEIKSTQDWLPIKNILENGIIKKDEHRYIKIIKVNPINFNLKSILEKEPAVGINSYCCSPEKKFVFKKEFQT